MTEINITSLINNQMKNDPGSRNIILNVNVKHAYTTIFFIFFMILSNVVLFIRIQEQQIQINSLILMHQDNNQYNRVDASNRLHRSIDYNDSVSPIISSILELSNQTEVRDDKNSGTNILMSYNQIVSDQSTDHENNTIKKNDSSFSIVTKSQEKLTNLFFDSNNRQNILRSETQNYTSTEDETSSNHRLITWSKPRARRLRRNEEESEKQQQSEEIKGETQRQNEEKQQQSEEEGKEQQQSEKKSEKQRRNEGKSKRRRQNEEKNGKRRQNEAKGDKRRQNRGGRKHNRKRSRPLVATFVGAVPELKLTNTAYIGPWFKSERDNHQYDLTKFHLVENNMAIQVGISGLYMISVQIFYFGNPLNNSYWILLNSEGSSTKRKLVTCAAASFNNASEVSCYTSVVTYLQKGDRLSLQQREKDRLINMREGYSQIQIMMIADDRRRST